MPRDICRLKPIDSNARLYWICRHRNVRDEAAAPLRMLGVLSPKATPCVVKQNFRSLKALTRQLPIVALGDAVRRRFLSAQLAAQPVHAALRGPMPLPAAVARRLASVQHLSAMVTTSRSRQTAPQRGRKRSAPR